MKKRTKVFFIFTIVILLSFTIISANIFSDFWNRLTGNDNVNLSPGDIPEGVDSYCAQVAGYDVFTGIKTSSGYGVSDDELINCYGKLYDGEIDTYQDAFNLRCENYICGLYRGSVDGILTDSTIDKKCAREDGWPVNDFNNNCQTWCPSSLNQIWSSTQKKCVLKTTCGNGVCEYGETTSNCINDCPTTFVNNPICGNNILESGEQCDIQKLNGQNCISLGKGYDGGILRCNENCIFDESGCIAYVEPNVNLCGNGIINAGEQCDDGQNPPQSGDGCNGICQINSGWSCEGEPSECTQIPLGERACGNGVIDNGEICDGNIVSCISGGIRGTQECSNNCLGWNACSTLNVCGDGILNNDEECDDANTLNNDGCSGICKTEEGYFCDTNTESRSICQINQDGGSVCGNNVKEFGEYCDNGPESPSRERSCNYMGVIGIETCSDDCLSFGICSSYGECGDGTKNVNEECDGADLGSETCSRNGYRGGELLCNFDCTLNFEGCTSIISECGNGIKEGDEICDGDIITCGQDKSIQCLEDCSGYTRCYNRNDCGNGILNREEECDDGNIIDNDGCYECKIELDYICYDEPSECFIPVCEENTLNNIEFRSDPFTIKYLMQHEDFIDFIPLLSTNSNTHISRINFLSVGHPYSRLVGGNRSELKFFVKKNDVVHHKYLFVSIDNKNKKETFYLQISKSCDNCRTVDVYKLVDFNFWKDICLGIKEKDYCYIDDENYIYINQSVSSGHYVPIIPNDGRDVYLQLFGSKDVRFDVVYDNYGNYFDIPIESSVPTTNGQYIFKTKNQCNEIIKIDRAFFNEEEYPEIETLSNNPCGDGICDGGENFESCPNDCEIDNCFDSDVTPEILDGLNYFVNGQTTGYDSNGVIQTLDDGCIESDGNNNGWLRETFCSDNIATYVDYDCSTIGKVCGEGMCIPTYCADRDIEITGVENYDGKLRIYYTSEGDVIDESFSYEGGVVLIKTESGNIVEEFCNLRSGGENYFNTNCDYPSYSEGVVYSVRLNEGCPNVIDTYVIFDGMSDYVCGNKIIEENEQCDDGNDVNDDECNNLCRNTYCGDNKVQRINSMGDEEICDRNYISCHDEEYNGLMECGSDCSSYGECIINQKCGDTIVNGNEQCDDGNTIDIDGCLSNCRYNRDLILYNNFNENNVVIDRSGYNNQFIIHGDVGSDIRFGSGSQFLNPELKLTKYGYLEIINEENFDFENEFTIMAYVYPDSSNEEGVIFSKRNLGNSEGYSLGYSSNDKMFKISVGDKQYSVDYDITDHYHHVALSGSTTNGFKLYVDGEEIFRTESEVLSIPLNDVNPRIGGDYNPLSITNNGYEGRLDEIRVYSRELSKEEINLLYENSCFNTFCRETLACRELDFSVDNIQCSRNDVKIDIRRNDEGYNKEIKEMKFEFYDESGEGLFLLTSQIGIIEDFINLVTGNQDSFEGLTSRQFILEHENMGNSKDIEINATVNYLNQDNKCHLIDYKIPQECNDFCRIKKAYWNNPNGYINEPNYMIVETENCNDQKIEINIYEKDSLIDDRENEEPLIVDINYNRAIESFFSDVTCEIGFLNWCIDDEPEYYFIVNLIENEEVVETKKSESPYLRLSNLRDDETPDEDILLFGQEDLSQTGPDTIVPNRMYHAAGITIDKSSNPNRVYVVDSGNSRVLGFNSLGVCQPEGVVPVTNSQCQEGEVFVCPPGYEITPSRLPGTVGTAPMFSGVDCTGDEYMFSLELPRRNDGRKVCKSIDIFSLYIQSAALLSSCYNNRNRATNVVKIIEGTCEIPPTSNSCTSDSDCSSGEICNINPNKNPDIIFGQKDYDTGQCNGNNLVGIYGNPSKDTLCFMGYPYGTNVAEQWGKINIDVDSDGNLYVPDKWNNRVLRYNDPYGTGNMPCTENNFQNCGEGDNIADFVYGQNDFVSNKVNGNGNPNSVNSKGIYLGGDGSTGLGVSIEETENRKYIWISDNYNHRILRFGEDSKEADIVIGQNNFDTKENVCHLDVDNQIKNKFCHPSLAKVDPSTGKLYINDEYGGFQSRILVFNPNPSFSNGMEAEKIIRPKSGPLLNSGGVSKARIQLYKNVQAKINTEPIIFYNSQNNIASIRYGDNDFTLSVEQTRTFIINDITYDIKLIRFENPDQIEIEMSYTYIKHSFSSSGFEFNTFDGVGNDNVDYSQGVLWSTEHDDNIAGGARRVSLIDNNGNIIKTVGSVDQRYKGGDNRVYARCSNTGEFDNFKLYAPSASVAFDKDNNMYIADEMTFHIARYELPYNTFTQNENVCLPETNGGWGGNIFGEDRSPNSITGLNLGWDIVGVSIFNNQLIVKDVKRYTVWDNYLNEVPGRGSSADIIVGQNSPNTRSGNTHQIPSRAFHTIDDRDRLWTFTQTGKLAIYNLPFQNGEVPLKLNAELYWNNDRNGDPINYYAYGIAYDELNDNIWIADGQNHRLLRISNKDNFYDKLYVDAVIGQPNKATTKCNHYYENPWTADGPSSASSLCAPLDIEFDNNGNLYVVENNYEGHGNMRIVVYLAGELPDTPEVNNDVQFPMTSARKVFGRDNFVSYGRNDFSPVSIAFNSRNEMVVGTDGYYLIPNERATHQLLYYKDPLKRNIDGSFIQDQDPNGYINLALGAPGEILFDEHDNLIVQDHTWPRVLIINFNQNQGLVK